MNTSLYGKIATLIFIIIFLIDMNTDYLKVTNMKKLKMNKIVFVLIALFVLFVIEYIEDFITYNYLDDYLKKDEPPSPDCYQNSYYDAILAGVPEELVFRLLISIGIFNLFQMSSFRPVKIIRSVAIAS